jgi:uncharacterized protein YfaS (alpha-2-macroglobulin family)
VDEALLELQPNDSWNVLAALLQRRSYGVETATAQMQVIGKRHYGRKAVGRRWRRGKSPTRELLDTLLLWKPAVQLDANGRTQIDVPLNDALTSFRIVAVAQSVVMVCSVPERPASRQRRICKSSQDCRRWYVKVIITMQC